MRDSLAVVLGLVQRPAEGVHFSCILFGEGYGPGIQKNGGRYATSKSFRAFDLATFKTTYEPAGFVGGMSGTGTLHPVTTGPLWRSWYDMETVARGLSIETVPVVSRRMDMSGVVEYVRGNHDSLIAHVREQEGVVARTDPYLYDSRHDRVMFKLKGKDLR
jgi:hypothetical protein